MHSISLLKGCKSAILLPSVGYISLINKQQQNLNQDVNIGDLNSANVIYRTVYKYYRKIKRPKLYPQNIIFPEADFTSILGTISDIDPT